MATDTTGVGSVTNTLSTTTADSVTLLQAWDEYELENHSASVDLFVRWDGTTAVTDADNNTRVPPLSSKKLGCAGRPTFSIVGNGNKYTLMGLTALAARG